MSKACQQAAIIIATALLSSAVYFSLYFSTAINKGDSKENINFAVLYGGAAKTNADPNNYAVANKESQGFFTDISEHHWRMMKDRTRQQEKPHCTDPTRGCPETADTASSGQAQAHVWYYENYYPNFSCPHERRVGGGGDGPKWVCDVHRITQKASDCLIYSVGSNGDFNFEISVFEEIHPECEVHTFDPEIRGGNFGEKAPVNVHYHAWGFGDEATAASLNAHGRKGKYKTIKQTIEELGHVGKVIDLFKIDCEGCEWSTYKEWFEADVTLRQILVETHRIPKEADDFFENVLRKEGYVLFHKEPNVKYSRGGGLCVEWAFLKMDTTFFV